MRGSPRGLGMTEMASQLSGKRLELLKATVPGLSRVAVFWNPPNPAYGPVLTELEAAAPSVGVKLLRLEVRVPEDFEGAFETAIRQRAGALLIPGDPLVTNRPRVIADLALKYRLPTVTDFRELPGAGGLLSFGPDLVDSYRRAASHVDKILKGANPGDLPMEQPTKFDLVVNEDGQGPRVDDPAGGAAAGRCGHRTMGRRTFVRALGLGILARRSSPRCDGHRDTLSRTGKQQEQDPWASFAMRDTLRTTSGQGAIS